MPPGSDSPASPLEWGEDGRPRSRLYGDVYFSAEDGLAESRAVFLAGCGLPDAWAGRARFTVGELGFGTGLNILALLELWRRTRPDGGRLHVFSIEAHPIGREEAARALARWPELAGLAAPLLARWPGSARGVHRLELPEFGVILDLAVMEVAEALTGWTGRADAWFLDGFAPALNPAMWSAEVLRLIADRSAPGARAATFTVAGQVRRDLAAAGFVVDKRPGFGRKRERLEARFPGEAAPAAPGRRIAIVGGGIAGAAAARAVRALGAEAVLVEREAPGAGASGNPAALVTPRLDAGLAAPAQLFAAAFARAVELYDEIPGAILSRGVLQLAGSARDEDRFARVAASDLFEPKALAMLTPEQAGARLGEPAPAALAQDAALVIDPARVLAAWTGEVLRADVASLRRGADASWSLHDSCGDEIARVDGVILCAGPATAELAEAPLQPVRGQASWAPGAQLSEAVAWGGYAVPMPGAVLFGATHDRDDRGTELREADHARNLAQLAKGLPRLAERLAGLPLQGRASVRAATPDRLPLAGAAPGAPERLQLLTGFGSRGFSLAPLLAEHVAAELMGTPSPLPAPLAALVEPGRFVRRRAVQKARATTYIHSGSGDAEKEPKR